VRHLIGRRGRGPRSALLLLAGATLLLSACHRAGSAPDAPAPAASSSIAIREAKYVQIDLAVNPGATVDAVAKGTLVACGAGSAADCWRADPKFFPTLGAAKPAVTLQAYASAGAISFAFSGAATQYAKGADGDLPKLLGALCARSEAAGGSLYQTDDEDGSTVSAAAIAGHDVAQAAMALVDVWKNDLDVDYSFGPDDDPSATPRASLVDLLRRSATLEDRLKRFPGAKLERSEGVVVLRFTDATANTHDLASAIADDELHGAAAPRTVGTSGS